MFDVIFCPVDFIRSSVRVCRHVKETKMSQQ